MKIKEAVYRIDKTTINLIMLLQNRTERTMTQYTTKFEYLNSSPVIHGLLITGAFDIQTVKLI